LEQLFDNRKGVGMTEQEVLDIINSRYILEAGPQILEVGQEKVRVVPTSFHGGVLAFYPGGVLNLVRGQSGQGWSVKPAALCGCAPSRR